MDKFTKEEFEGIKEMVNSITTHIPKHQMNLVWESYKRITGSTEATPCSCPSAGKHWKKAMNIVSEYVKENS
jgi:hypothetical protein